VATVRLLRHSSGTSSVDIVFSGAPLYDAEHQLRGIVFVLEDVTKSDAFS
jgi:hypothetical protein